MGVKVIRILLVEEYGDPAPKGAGSVSSNLRFLGYRSCAHQSIAQVVLVPGGYLRVQPGRLHLVALALLGDGRVEEIVRTLGVGFREVGQRLVIAALLQLQPREDALQRALLGGIPAEVDQGLAL